MSFQDLAGPSSGGAGARSVRSGSNGGIITTDMLRTSLLNYQQQVNLYEKLTRSLGGPRDSPELRSQLQAQEAAVKEIGVRIEQQVNKASTDAMSTASSGSKQEKDRIRAEINKMNKDSLRLKSKFENTVRSTHTRIREVDAVARRVGESTSGQATSGTEFQQLQLHLDQEDIDERILQEREEEILKINQSVVKVNEIFRDLGELVSRQQEDIDTIETNVHQSHAAAKQGLEQVQKAAKYQPGCNIS